MLVAAMVVGSAIDISRAYKVKNRLQAACDSAVLAGRRSVTTNGYDEVAETAAQSYFETNFDEAAQETRTANFEASSDDEGNTIIGTADTVLDTLIMRLFGFFEFNLSVNCTASMGVGNADVMMVLDTTGSMNTVLSGSTTRIMALRTAMNNFYSTLSTATAGTNARVRYGFVPYSTTVNVGRLLNDLDPDYIRDTHTYQSRQAVFVTNRVVTGYDSTAASSTSTPSTIAGTTTSWVNDSRYSRYSTSSACTTALPPNETTWSNYGTATTTSSTTINASGQQEVTTVVTQPQRMAQYQCSSRWIQVRYQQRSYVTTTVSAYNPIYTDVTSFDRWDYKPVTYDTSAFKTFATVSTPTGTSGTAQNSTWAGCIEERQTANASAFSYSSVTGYTPATALDIDIDSAPTSDDATKWAPLWPDIAYVRNSVSSRTRSTTTTGVLAGSACPAQARQLAEMDASAFSTFANSLVAGGNTYLDIGMIWGGRMLSPDGIFADTVNDAPTNGGEVSRHIIFMTDGIMEPYAYMQTAWGIEWWDRRVTTDGSSNDAARHTSRFRAVCDAIRAKGIRIWVIAFTSGLSTDLTYCASDNSSYTANNATELNTAFQEIAKNVGELRITQ